MAGFLFGVERMGRVCSVPGCPNLSTKDGRCSQHPKPVWEGRRGFEGYGNEWKKLRAQVLREEPYCRQCGDKAVTVDHIVPKAFGGTDSRFNLQSLCDACRRIKDAQDAARGRKQN